MNLNDAIKHAREKSCGTDQCSKDHAQLAGWLEELAATRKQLSGCTRSHPHENMSPMCELRTEIARLNNQLAHKDAELSDLCKLLETPERNEGEPTELEMHRADYEACKAAGFQSPGELLSAYKTQSKQLETRLSASSIVPTCSRRFTEGGFYRYSDPPLACDQALFDTFTLQSAIAEAVAPYKRDAERWKNAARLLREAYIPDGHTAPHDCFATGPKTGDYIQDLIACPGCAAEDAYDAALAAKEGE